MGCSLRLAAFGLAALLLLLGACADAPDRSTSADYDDVVAEQHAGDAPTPTPITTAAGGDVLTSRPAYARLDDRAITGFLARPAADVAADGEPLAAVIVIHEWWGLNENIEAMAVRLAEAGYLALAVDLYGGEVAATPEEAQRFVRRARQREGLLEDNLRQAYGYLADAAGAERVGAVGWCFGGGWAVRSAFLLSGLDAAVVYYGDVPTGRDRVAMLDTPVLGLFGADDPSIPVSQVRAFERMAQRFGKDVRVEVYEGAGHAFANPSGQRYEPDAAEDAWDKTLAFLAEHLKAEHLKGEE